MAATPKNGTIRLCSQPGGKGASRSINIYRSDVNAAYVTFAVSGTAGTGSPNYWRNPYGFPLYIHDLALVTGTADTTTLSVEINQTDTGNTLDYIAHVSTSSDRPKPDLVIPPYGELRLKQNT